MNIFHGCVRTGESIKLIGLGTADIKYVSPIAGRHPDPLDRIVGMAASGGLLAADLLQGMGMSVAQLPGGEIVSAMERGVIDAFEFNNPSSDSRFGAQNVAKNYYLSSYHEASAFLTLTAFVGIFVWYVPRLDLGVVIGVTLALALVDLYLSAGERDKR